MIVADAGGTSRSGPHGAAQVAIGDDARSISTPASSTTPRQPKRLAVISSSAARASSSRPGSERHRRGRVHAGQLLIHQAQPKPQPAAGMEARGSRPEVKPRRLSNATASASPSAICIVVLVVGASPIGQASGAGGKQQDDVGGAGECGIGVGGDADQLQMPKRPAWATRSASSARLARSWTGQAPRHWRHDHAQIAVRGFGSDG